MDSQMAQKSAKAAPVRRIRLKQGGIGLMAMPTQLKAKTACRGGPQRRAVRWPAGQRNNYLTPYCS